MLLEGSRDRRDQKRPVSPPRVSDILKTRLSYDDAASESCLPHRKSTLKSVEHTDLNCRHPTTQLDFDFSPSSRNGANGWPA